MTRILPLAAAAAALAAPALAHAGDDDYVQVATGIDYSDGDYGADQNTEMVALPLSVKARTGALTLRASVPWLHVTGPADVIPGQGGVGSGGGNAAIATRSGIGDVNLGASYSLPLGSATWFDLGGKVKLPTASRAKALGTGTTDVTLTGEVLHSFGRVSAAIGGGRRFNGSNADYPLRDVWQANAGLYYGAGRTSFGLDYDWRQASLAGAANRSEVTGSVTQKLSDALRLQGYAYTGLADGSPDVGAGAQVLFRFGG